MVQRKPIRAGIVNGTPVGFVEMGADEYIGQENGGTGATTAAGAIEALGAAGIGVPQSFTKAQRGKVVALADAAVITPDFDAGNNFSVTLGGNRTLANPTNLTAGQSGVIAATQDATGGRVLSFGSYFKFKDGVVPVLATTANAVTCLAYQVVSPTVIWLAGSGELK